MLVFSIFNKFFYVNKLISNIPYFALLLFCFVYTKTFACPKCDKLFGDGKYCENCNLNIKYDIDKITE